MIPYKRLWIHIWVFWRALLMVIRPVLKTGAPQGWPFDSAALRHFGRWRPRWSNRLEPGAVQIMDKVSILHLPPFLEIMSDSVCAHLSIEYKNDTISPGLYTNCRWECVLCGTRFVPEPLHRHLMIELESQLRNEFIRSS